MTAFYRNFPIPFEAFGGPLLFDLEKDPGETISFVRDNLDVVRRMQAFLQQGRAEFAPLAIDPETLKSSPVDLPPRLREQMRKGKPLNAGQNTPP